jgi:hypothetical protein
LVFSPRRLHTLLHLGDFAWCHTGERIQRRFMFLFAMTDQFVVRSAGQVRRNWGVFIQLTLPESEQLGTSVISVDVDKRQGTVQAHPTL